MTRLARPPLYSDPYRMNAQCLSAVRAGACPPVRCPPRSMGTGHARASLRFRFLELLDGLAFANSRGKWRTCYRHQVELFVVEVR